eukprot:Clim_evm80s218 gene=Clim_evmTU80s218
MADPEGEFSSPESQPLVAGQSCGDCRDSIFNAALEGHLPCLKFIVEDLGTDPDVQDEDGESPVQLAASGGHLECLEYLVRDRNADVDVKDVEGSTPCHWAARNGYLHCLRFLHESGANFNLRDNDGDTPAALAAFDGHLNCLQFLTSELKVDIDTRNSYGSTMVHAAARNGHIRCLTYLINILQCDKDVVNENGKTPLHLACAGGHLSCVRFLIEECGANVKAEDKEGNTPLHWAAQGGHISSVRFLMEECGADCNKLNAEKETPIYWAASNGSVNCLRYMINECRGDASIKESSGLTPAHIAAQEGHVGCLRFLLEEGHSDLDTRDHTGQTVMHYAVRSGELKIVKYLVEDAQADVHVKDNQGNTCIHIAATEDDFAILRYLVVELGAETGIANDEGNLPFQLATDPKCKAVLQSALKLRNDHLLTQLSKAEEEINSMRQQLNDRAASGLDRASATDQASGDRATTILKSDVPGHLWDVFTHIRQTYATIGDASRTASFTRDSMDSSGDIEEPIRKKVKLTDVKSGDVSVVKQEMDVDDKTETRGRRKIPENRPRLNLDQMSDHVRSLLDVRRGFHLPPDLAWLIGRTREIINTMIYQPGSQQGSAPVDDALLHKEQRISRHANKVRHIVKHIIQDENAKARGDKDLIGDSSSEQTTGSASPQKNVKEGEKVNTDGAAGDNKVPTLTELESERAKRDMARNDFLASLQEEYHKTSRICEDMERFIKELPMMRKLYGELMEGIGTEQVNMPEELAVVRSKDAGRIRLEGEIRTVEEWLSSHGKDLESAMAYTDFILYILEDAITKETKLLEKAMTAATPIRRFASVARYCLHQTESHATNNAMITWWKSRQAELEVKLRHANEVKSKEESSRALLNEMEKIKGNILESKAKVFELQAQEARATARGASMEKLEEIRCMREEMEASINTDNEKLLEWQTLRADLGQSFFPELQLQDDTRLMNVGVLGTSRSGGNLASTSSNNALPRALIQSGRYIEGRRFSDFEEVSSLGRRVRHVRAAGKDWILKRYDSTCRTALIKELGALCRIKHPSVVRMHAFFRDGPDWYVQMPFFPGGNLKDLLSRRTDMRLDEKRSIFHRLACALAYLHDSHITHADLKLENVVMDSESKPVLVDFDVCSDRANALTVTKYHGPRGTLGYMAPEIVDGKCQPNPVSDVWAFAVMLYRGMVSIDGDVLVEGQHVMWNRNVAREKDLNLENMLARMFTLDPEQRLSMAHACVHPFFSDSSLTGLLDESRMKKDGQQLAIVYRRLDELRRAYMQSVWRIHVSRPTLVRDVMLHFRAKPEIIRKRLLSRMSVVYTHEAGVDEGGLSTDLITQFFRRIIANKKLFETPGSNHLALPAKAPPAVVAAKKAAKENPGAKANLAGKEVKKLEELLKVEAEAEEAYKAMGAVMAKCVVDGLHIETLFAPTLTKFFLSAIQGTEASGSISMHDLKAFDPDLATHLSWLLSNHVDDLGLTFDDLGGIYHGRDIPEDTLLTEENKGEYISRKLYDVLLKDREHRLESMASGFWTNIQHLVGAEMALLSHAEFRLLLFGAGSVAAADVIALLCSEGDDHGTAEPSENNAAMERLKNVLEGWSRSNPIKLRHFLEYVTGSPAMPREESDQIFILWIPANTDDELATQGRPQELSRNPSMSSFGSGVALDEGDVRNNGKVSVPMLPIAHTCTRVLEMAPYSSEREMDEALSKAFELGLNAGFHIA